MSFDDEEREIQEMIGMLVESGAMVLNGVDKNGEVVYNMVPEVLKEVLPELYDVFMEEINSDLISLVEQGLVNVDYDENLNPMFSVSEEGEKVIKELGLS